MGLSRVFSALTDKFAGSESGTVAVIYAMTAVPLILAAGAGIDYARYAAVKTHMQAAIDAGALAGAAAAGASDSTRIVLAEETFAANIATGSAAGYGAEADFTITDGDLVASARVDMPTSLMSVAGIDAMAVEAGAQIHLALERKAEIALVLDYSGSMADAVGGGVKYVAMRKAATDLVNDVAAASPGKVKFGLVPFSHHIYASLPKAHVLGTTGIGTWTGCTQDRKYPFNLTDATPTGDAASLWGQPFAPVHASSGCSGYAANNLKIKRLTSDFAAVKSQLAAMTPYAWTHIALGVEFGYHLLSDNAPFTEGASYTDDETRKFMVVLTDGMQTEPAFGPGTTRSVAQGEDNLEALCDNAKESGITIITLAFDLDDTTTRKRLRNCASDPDRNFFVADSATDLSAAFAAIRTAITADIYLSR